MLRVFGSKHRKKLKQTLESKDQESNSKSSLNSSLSQSKSKISPTKTPENKSNDLKDTTIQQTFQTLSSNSQNYNELDLILRSKTGLNLNNNRAIYNLYDIPVANDSTTTKKGSRIISRSNSNTKYEQNNSIKRTFSNTSNKSIVSKEHRSLNPLKLIKTISKNDHTIVDKTPSLSLNFKEIKTKNSSIKDDPDIYQKNHEKLRQVLNSSLNDNNFDDKSFENNIKISVINSNDKVFLQTVPSIRSRGIARVNRSLSRNITNSLDDDLHNYEARSSAANVPLEVNEEGEDDDKNPNLHMFAVIVSIPDPNQNFNNSIFQKNSSIIENSTSSINSLPSSMGSDNESYTKETVVSDINDEGPNSLHAGTILETNVDLNNLEISLNLVCKIIWKNLTNNNNIPISDVDYEQFLIGDVQMKLNLLKDFNYYISPEKNVNENWFNRSVSSSIGENVNHSYTEHLELSSNSQNTKIFAGLNESQSVQKIKLKTLEEIKNSNYLDKKSALSKMLNISNNYKKTKFKYPAGDYIFIIPMIFDSNLPETIRSPHASLNYKFNLFLKRFIPTSILDQNSLSRENSRLSGIGSTLKKIASNFTMESKNFDNDFDNEENDINSSDDDSNFDIRSIVTSRASKEVSLIDTEAINDDQDSDSDSDSAKSYKGEELYRTLSHRPSKTHLLVKEEIINKSFRLPVIRVPPIISSPLNKPIYVNRVWNDRVNYEISFPSRFVRLNSEVPINIELIPLDKNILLKKVKVNVLEKISYVSKDLKNEFDEGKKNSKDHNIKERIIPLAELRTTNEGGIAIREEIIELLEDKNEKKFQHFNPFESNNKHDNKLKDSNIFAYCLNEEEKDIVIDRSLKFKIPLFFKGIKFQHQQYHSDNHFTKAISRKKSLKEISKLKNNSNILVPDDYLTLGKTEQQLQYESINSNTKIQYGESGKIKVSRCIPRISEFGMGDFETHQRLIPELYPDSNRFNYISISHRLQISFRVCQKENNSKDDEHLKYHHYEVIIDAPIQLISELCDDLNTSLPPYLENLGINETLITKSEETKMVTEQLPSFEEYSSDDVNSLVLLSPISTVYSSNTDHELIRFNSGNSNYLSSNINEVLLNEENLRKSLPSYEESCL